MKDLSIKVTADIEDAQRKFEAMNATTERLLVNVQALVESFADLKKAYENSIAGMAMTIQGAVEQYANSQGTGGRDVQHIDAPDANEVGLPRSAWIPAADIELGQSQFASAQDQSKGFLMQEDFLTPAQRDKYMREVQS